MNDIFAIFKANNISSMADEVIAHAAGYISVYMACKSAVRSKYNTGGW